MLVCVDTIYVDSLFALNLIADYLLLLVGARVSGAVIHRLRIAAAAVELYKRREAGRRRSERIRSSQDIDRILRPILADLENEEFWLLPLTHSSGTMKPIRISSGAIDYTSADVRIIMRKLLEVGATKFAIAHNHPSGNRMPSRDDDRLTEAIRDAASIFNIHLLDHLIITYQDYYSYSDEGAL